MIIHWIHSILLASFTTSLTNPPILNRFFLVITSLIMQNYYHLHCHLPPPSLKPLLPTQIFYNLRTSKQALWGFCPTIQTNVLKNVGVGFHNEARSTSIRKGSERCRRHWKECKEFARAALMPPHPPDTFCDCWRTRTQWPPNVTCVPLFLPRATTSSDLCRLGTVAQKTLLHSPQAVSCGA